MDYADMMEKLATLMSVIAFGLILTFIFTQTNKVILNVQHQLCMANEDCPEGETK